MTAKAETVDYYTYSVTNGSVVITMKGDFNGDQILTAADAVLLLNNILFGDGQYSVIGKCDLDGDSDIDTDDVVYLLYHILFGEEYPFA